MIFNFSANGLDLGNHEGENQEEAQEVFAQDSVYRSWAAMVEQAEEFGGNTVEVREVAASMNAHTNTEIATSYALWIEYFDTDAAMSEEEFNAMSIEEKLEMLNSAFGE